MSYSAHTRIARRRWLEEHLAEGVDDATLYDQEQAAMILDNLGFTADPGTVRHVMPGDGERIQDDWYMGSPAPGTHLAGNQRLIGIGVPELPAPYQVRDELREELGY